METSKVMLGLFDGYMSHRRDTLTSETKLGGRATYLPVLTPEQQHQLEGWTRCRVCKQRMFLLLQAYSPLASLTGAHTTPQPHHRMLYVFCCNSASCAQQPSSSFCAFSLQVDAEDGNVNEEEEEEKEEEEEDAQFSPLPPSQLPEACFPPCFVYVEQEPSKAEAAATLQPTDLEKELARMAEVNARAKATSGITESDLPELEAATEAFNKARGNGSGGGDDGEAFDKFRERMERAPTQVLRYYARISTSIITTTTASTGDTHNRNNSSNAAVRKETRPLFMQPSLVSSELTVPPCPHCGAALLHEVQVMPTSLYYLRVSEYTRGRNIAAKDSTTGDSKKRCGDDEKKADAGVRHVMDGVDFATVTVYTCSRECAQRERGTCLRREFVFVEAPPALPEQPAP